MKKIISKIVTLSILSTLVLSNIGCANSVNQVPMGTSNNIVSSITTETTQIAKTGYETFSGKTLNVKLGYEGKTYVLELFNNQTAEDIYNHVSLATWNLPIYEFSGYDNADKYQYYDIPRRYKVTSNPESINIEQVGDVYYSEPNRMIMFFRNAEIPVNYTKVGKIKIDNDFTKNVEENPTLQGWGNKMIIISR